MDGTDIYLLWHCVNSTQRYDWHDKCYNWGQVSLVICKFLVLSGHPQQHTIFSVVPDSKVHGAIMRPTWGPHGSCRPQVGPMWVSWKLLSVVFIVVDLLYAFWYHCSQTGGWGVIFLGMKIPLQREHSYTIHIYIYIYILLTCPSWCQTIHLWYSKGQSAHLLLQIL